jgi:very-short-patch-repair endonuclease
MADFARFAEHHYDQRDILRAKALRKGAPLAERLLWEALRATAKNEGLRFRRQHPIHPYIVDLVCLKANLVIEIDGSSHDSRRLYDQQRDAYLKNLDYEVMRFTNEDVRQNLENVVLMVLNCAVERIGSLHAPLP